MVNPFQDWDLELMKFYQEDLVQWVRIKEKFEDDEEIRETARDFIVYNEWSIKQIREMMNASTERYREIEPVRWGGSDNRISGNGDKIKAEFFSLQTDRKKLNTYS